jgi:hypothetical protein
VGRDVATGALALPVAWANPSSRQRLEVVRGRVERAGSAPTS